MASCTFFGFLYIFILFIILNYILIIEIISIQDKLGIGDWGLGIGDWGFGPKPQTPNPKTQTPNPNKKINFF
jgi:hypothetical protein